MNEKDLMQKINRVGGPRQPAADPASYLKGTTVRALPVAAPAPAPSTETTGEWMANFKKTQAYRDLDALRRRLNKQNGFADD